MGRALMKRSGMRRVLFPESDVIFVQVFVCIRTLRGWSFLVPDLSVRINSYLINCVTVEIEAQHMSDWHVRL
jgi:hypothetical protein